MNITKKILLCTILLLNLSCSIKEDREDCPCILTINISDCGRFDESISLRGWTGTGYAFEKDINVRDNPEDFKVYVKKGDISYIAYNPCDNMIVTNSTITTKAGEQADSIFIYRTDIDCSGETAYDRVLLNKHFSTFHFDFISESESDSGISSIAIEAGFNGINMNEMMSCEGTFLYKCGIVNGKCDVRLPRQRDGHPINMKIFKGEKEIDSINISPLLEEDNFTWSKTDLDDVWLRFNYGTQDYEITIKEWEQGISYPEII